MSAETRVTDGGQAYNKVRADLFAPVGKWKYEVYLDYTGCQDVRGSGAGYFDPTEQATLALARATDNATSGVSTRELGDHWTLVVIDLPDGWPVLVHPAGASR